jgi:hypothetical protein
MSVRGAVSRLSAQVRGFAYQVARTVLDPITGRQSIRRWLRAEIDIAKTELIGNFFLAYEAQEELATMEVLHDYDKIYELLTGTHYIGMTEEQIVAIGNWKDRDIKRYLGWTEEEIRDFREREAAGMFPDFLPPEQSAFPELSMEWQSGGVPEWPEIEAPETVGETGEAGEAEFFEDESLGDSETALQGTALEEPDRGPPIPGDVASTDTESEDGQLSVEPVPVFPWAISAMEFIADAQIRTDRRSPLYDPSAALRSLYAAKRQLLRAEAQVDEDSVERNAMAIFHESESLSKSWRRRAIRDYLCEGESLKQGIELGELIEASEILHDHYLEQYQWVENLRINILTFLALTVLSVVGIFVIPTVLDVPFPSIGAGFGFETTVLVLVFGAVGASISGIRAIETEPESLHSMTQILGYWLPITRIVIGSVSAFLVSLFLGAGFVETDLLSLPVILGIAFASGFSERLLLRSVRSFEGIPMGRSATK